MKRPERQRGAAVIEFTILLPLLIVFVFGIIEFGFLWLQSHYIGNAAREGARIAAKGNTSDVDITEAVKGVLRGLYEDSADNCCTSSNFIYVDINRNGFTIPDTTIDGAQVTVRVQTNQYWDPILWDLLTLLQPGDQNGIESITQSAVFALE